MSDTDWARRREHLTAIERIEDPATISLLDRIGVAAGWRCLEVGGGGGSIAAWLCRKVGTGGRVVATDIETRFLAALELPQLEVVEHDAATDDFATAAYDLVHARNVLVHIPHREAVLRKMASTVKPGGWILVEEPDVSTDAPDPALPEPMKDLYAGVVRRIYLFVEERGLDPRFGARVFSLLRSLGFEPLHAEGRTQVFRGGVPEVTSPHRLSFAGLRESIVAAGRVEEREYDQFLALYDDPSFAWRDALRMATWGRRPLTG